jgi:polyhydroxyalkanoate synthase
VYRFSGGETGLAGPPVLLVPPLAAPALCFDLRRGCSVAQHLIEAGRRTYLVDYGNISFTDRRLGIEHWINDVLPRTIRKVSEDAGGQDVHIVSWCLGGIFSLLTAADQADLPIGSITAVASPIDFNAIPMVAPARPLVDLTRGHLLGAYRLFGGAPRSVVRWAYQLTGFDKYITKPIAVLSHLDDREFLAQIEAVDHFMDNMIAYPGRTFGQLYHHFFRANDLADGVVTIDDRKISLSELSVPLLVIAGADDGIAPSKAVKRLIELVEKVPETRYEVCPGGHLGVLTGRSARKTTWPLIDAFLDDHAPF